MKRLLIPLLCFMPYFVSSQILNIDKSDTCDYSSKAKFNLNLTSGLEVDKQKTTVYDATNTLEAMWQKSRNLLIAAASYRFTYNGPDDILNAGFLHLRYRYNYKNLIQPEPFIQYQWDSKRGIRHRFVTGMNARYNVFKGSAWDFNAGLGVMYENELWGYDAVNAALIPVNAGLVSNQSVKANSYLRFDVKANEISLISFSTFFQNSFRTFSPRIAPHVQWDLNAGKHLAYSISLSGMYDTHPVVPIDKFYYSLSNNLVLKF